MKQLRLALMIGLCLASAIPLAAESDDDLFPADKLTSNRRQHITLASAALLTVLVNFSFPEEFIGYFTNQLFAELAGHAYRDVPCGKKVGIGLTASFFAGMFDWYVTYPSTKRNLGLGMAGLQTCIVFAREYMFEQGLGFRQVREAITR